MKPAECQNTYKAQAITAARQRVASGNLPPGEREAGQYAEWVPFKGNNGTDARGGIHFKSENRSHSQSKFLWVGILQALLPKYLSLFDEKTPLNRQNQILVSNLLKSKKNYVVQT